MATKGARLRKRLAAHIAQVRLKTEMTLLMLLPAPAIGKALTAHLTLVLHIRIMAAAMLAQVAKVGECHLTCAALIGTQACVSHCMTAQCTVCPTYAQYIS